MRSIYMTDKFYPDLRHEARCSGDAIAPACTVLHLRPQLWFQLTNQRALINCCSCRQFNAALAVDWQQQTRRADRSRFNARTLARYQSHGPRYSRWRSMSLGTKRRCHTRNIHQASKWKGSEYHGRICRLVPNGPITACT